MTHKDRARKFWKGGASIEKVAELIREVQEEERTACAKVADIAGILGDKETCAFIADRIRARKEKA